MNNASHGSGTLYVGLPGFELHPLGDIEEQDLIEAVDKKDIMEVQKILSLHDHEATFTFNLTKKQIENFYDATFGITKTVLSIIRSEGNSRVAHLAKYGRKHRTRKKNVRRAYRIAERMAINENA